MGVGQLKNAPHNKLQFVEPDIDVMPRCHAITCRGDAIWEISGDRITDVADNQDAKEFYCGRHLTLGIRSANWHSNQKVEVREL